MRYAFNDGAGSAKLNLDSLTSAGETGAGGRDSATATARSMLPGSSAAVKTGALAIASTAKAAPAKFMVFIVVGSPLSVARCGLSLHRSRCDMQVTIGP